MASVVHLALLLALACTPAKAFQCPSRCKCHNSTKLVDCSNQKLSTIPSDLPNDVVDLDLSNNFIFDLSSLSLSNLTELKILQLSNNKISTWKSSWLATMPLLEELTLSQNSLTTPPKPLCSRLPALKHLHLGSNELNGSFPADYSHCLNLSRLTLSANPYESIDNTTLCSLASYPGHEVSKPQRPKLLSLKLNQLKLKSAQPGSLSCLGQRLQSLDLGQNSLPQTVLEGLIGGSCLPLLNTLNLRRSDQLRTVSVALLNCSESLQALMLDASPNVTELSTDALALTPKLRLLSLNRTNVSGWTGECLNQLQQLNSLDLSFTPVATIGGRNGSDTNPLRLLTDSDKFQRLSLTSASLECDCSLYWLWQQLRSNLTVRRKITGGAENLTCAGPPKARGAHLMQFNDLSDCVGFFTRKTVIIVACCGAGILVFLVFFVIVALLVKRRRRPSSGQDSAPEDLPPQITFSSTSSAASSVDDLRNPLVPPDVDRRGGAHRPSIWIRLRRFLRERRDTSSAAARGGAGGGRGRPPIFDPRPPEDYLSAGGE